MRRRNIRAKMKPVITLQWCPGCGRQVPEWLVLCDWCEWETPEAVDEAIQAWNGIMDQLQRPWLKDLLGFGHGCGCVCHSCEKAFYRHPETCPIHIATYPNIYEEVAFWAMRRGLDPFRGEVIFEWVQGLGPFAREIALHLLKEVGKDAKTEQ